MSYNNTQSDHSPEALRPRREYGEFVIPGQEKQAPRVGGNTPQPEMFARYNPKTLRETVQHTPAEIQEMHERRLMVGGMHDMMRSLEGLRHEAQTNHLFADEIMNDNIRPQAADNGGDYELAA